MEQTYLKPNNLTKHALYFRTMSAGKCVITKNGSNQQIIVKGNCKPISLDTLVWAS